MHALARSALIGGVVMTALAASIALGRGPVHQPATLAVKSDRLDAPSRPTVVQTESIKAPEPLMAALSEPVVEAIEPVRAKHKAAAPRDICTKHNLRKVWYGK